MSLNDAISRTSVCGGALCNASGRSDEIDLLCRIDTLDEIEYYRHGGILHYVLRQLLGA